jgi:hypothetical protein
MTLESKHVHEGIFNYLVKDEDGQDIEVRIDAHFNASKPITIDMMDKIRTAFISRIIGDGDGVMVKRSEIIKALEKRRQCQ